MLSLLFGKRNASASVAKERLQIVLAHERAHRGAPDFLPVLQREILAVLAKYVEVDPEMIRITHDKAQGMQMLEIDVPLDAARLKQRTGAPAHATGG